ncbi:TIGR02391 family protein, partial [Streptococcus suis]
MSAILIDVCNQQRKVRIVFDTIEYICKPHKYIDNPEYWKTLKRNINKTLIFRGFELDDSGKIQ